MTAAYPIPVLLRRLAVVLLFLVGVCRPMQITRTWTTKHPCQSVENPEWPFAFSKYAGQVEETKGRVSTNLQDVRHECEARGVRSKCHICEDIACGDSSSSSTCHYQLQGVNWDDMSKNIPTISDVPWAVGGLHRYDFGGNTTTHVCMYTSGQYPCQSSFGTDYSSCKVRCWGYGVGLSGRNNSAIAATSFESAGVNATPWTRPLPTATWSYPKSSAGENPGNPLVQRNFTMLPQGFTFTIAGSSDGEEGFSDGKGGEARFRHPEGVAIDHEGYAYIADTGNHAIRLISPGGRVTTLAGTGAPGNADDGLAANGIKFSSPSGISIWRGGEDNIVIFVADTGNHRIRKITGDVSTNVATGERMWSNVYVECFAGWCGSGPQAGLADGNRNQSRFDSPRGISVSSNGTVFVADTSNHLVRAIDQNGMTRILAGSTEIAEVNEFGDALEGCPSPCLAGVRGSLDGHSLMSRFYFPSDVAVTYGDESLFVTDYHHVRGIDLNDGHVSTLASTATPEEGERDGEGREATFNMPDAVSTTQDGTAYVVDATSCRIRRLRSTSLVADKVACADSLSSLIRPSGCSSYNTPVDRTGLAATPSAGNIFYNHGHRNVSHVDLGHDFIGRGIKECIGSPPPMKMDKWQWNDTDEAYPFNKNLVVDDHEYHQREDSNDGTIIKVLCPSSCVANQSQGGSGAAVAGGTFNDGNYYTEDSSICLAAVHAGILHNDEGGLVDAVISGELSADIPGLLDVSAKNGVVSRQLRNSDANQVVTVQSGSHDTIVQTIAGAPTTLLGESCGRVDALPPQAAMFATPTGVASYVNASLDDSNHLLYIADRNNHAIRAISAVCSFVCENGGRCVGSDLCQCPDGWKGRDCSVPICSTSCGPRHLCVAPDSCDCIPGYEGDDCTAATCVQKCENGGNCIAPDTCHCQTGWFGTNCSVPTCSQTCGNGGNCSSPNTCTCPSEWTGTDCRDTGLRAAVLEWRASV